MLMYRKFSLWDQEVKISFKIAIIIYAPKKRERERAASFTIEREWETIAFSTQNNHHNRSKNEKN